MIVTVTCPCPTNARCPVYVSSRIVLDFPVTACNGPSSFPNFLDNLQKKFDPILARQTQMARRTATSEGNLACRMFSPGVVTMSGDFCHAHSSSQPCFNLRRLPDRGERATAIASSPLPPANMILRSTSRIPLSERRFEPQSRLTFS